MSAATPSRRPRTLPALHPPRLTPGLVLGIGLFLIALGAALVAARIDVWALDETVFEESAIHYTTNLPHSLLHDVNARATDRLYSLVLSIAFRLFHDPAAQQIDHVLGVLMFVSAGVPIYLVARRIMRSPWYAVAIALLSVALPWLTLTTALFSENLSYPLFWWAFYACCEALRRPRLARDLLALVVIGLLIVTRIQFVSVFAGYVAAIVILGALRWYHRADRRHVRPGLVRVIRGHGLSVAIMLTAIIGLAYLRTTPQWSADAARLLGGYSNVVVRGAIAFNLTEALLVELLAIGLGVGLLPAIVSLTWWIRRLGTPRFDERDAYVIGGSVIAIAFVLLTAVAQFGYLGAITEERYFFYAAPLLWIGTAAALEQGGVRRGELVACGIALGAVFGTVPFLSPLTNQTAFLAPSESVVEHVITTHISQTGFGLFPEDVLAIVAFVAGVVAAALWVRRASLRAWWTFGLATALQLLITGYAYATITGNITGIPGSTGPYASSLSWVDQHARSDHVTWLQNVSAAAPPAITGIGEDQPRTTLFWNRRLDNWLSLPEVALGPPEFPLAALGGTEDAQVSIASGQVEPAAAVSGIHEFVGEIASPFLQLAGPVIARSPGGYLSLQQVTEPMRATWVASHLQIDGSFAPGAPVHVDAIAPPSQHATRIHLSFIFSAPPATTAQPAGRHTRVRLRFGSIRHTVSLRVGATAQRTVQTTVCAPAGRPVVPGTFVGTPAVAGGSVGILQHVIESTAQVASCP